MTGLFEIDLNYQPQYDDDYKRFCMKCSWNDADLGCTSPRGEEIWQCEMYIHYHPEEVKEFERSMEEWAKQKVESEDEKWSQ